MTTTHITPTIGRIVYYRGADRVTRAAIVTAVHGPFNVNLFVFPSNAVDPVMVGSHEAITHADPEQEPGCLNSWHWMPYQKAQAEKAAQVSAVDKTELRKLCIEMALRTPAGANYPNDVIDGAEAYMAYIESGIKPTKG